ncbi:hypothetical protein Leryth_015505 [Lithospermum erythrorhizon]|nr:hypothetical protein Leryth_015505 [Lithospermum erythrorhizon]
MATTCWSAENATRAYLRTLKMGKKDTEPDSSEFISALAAGNNAQLIVMACGGGQAESSIRALVAAANQTGGRVVCIFPGHQELHSSRKALGLSYTDSIEFVLGDATTLLLNEYKGADFVLVDCEMEDKKSVLVSARRSASKNGALVVGYNAIHCGPWFSNSNGMKVHFLPIGNGIMVSRIPPPKSHWIVEVDKCTGEEHVYRITSPRNKHIHV